MTKFNIEDLYSTTRSKGILGLTEDEKRALLLDTFMFLESENYHTAIELLENLTNCKMSDLEKSYDIDY